MTLSSIGFGHNPFGHHQYGFGDWAEEMLWKNMPEVYKDCDESGPVGSAVDFPLRKFQNALKPAYQEIRTRWHEFPYLWDAIRVPINQLAQLGYNVGITVDPTKPEGLQRSSVLNASQLWVNKGTDKGYELTAAFEGLLVTITPLWAETCGPANHVLGTIGELPSSFNLATTLLTPRPVSPGTVHLVVTTRYGTEETIVDDEESNLIGVGNAANGPLTRLDITPAVTLAITGITGLFGVGDTVIQGPNTGVVLASTGSQVTLQVIIGAFSTGPITDTTTGATATAAATFPNVLSEGETFVGLSSGTTAVMRDFRTTYSAIDKVDRLVGFTFGETIRGLSSNQFAVAGQTRALLQGPLQWKLNLINVVGAFSVSDEIVGTATGVIAAVCETCPLGISFVRVELITEPGFLIGETVMVGSTSGEISSIELASIDYVGGLMSGTTVPLQAGSTVRSVPRLRESGPTQFLPNYDEVIADLLPMDDVQSDRYVRWPLTLHPVRYRSGILQRGECRSYSLRLFFYTPDDTEIDDFVDLALRLEQSIEQFRPLHVRFDNISFDGARAQSQVWRTGQVIADSSAASVWTTSATGSQLASSQIWTTSSFTADVTT